jgi:hypothetical protein
MNLVLKTPSSGERISRLYPAGRCDDTVEVGHFDSPEA